MLRRALAKPVLMRAGQDIPGNNGNPLSLLLPHSIEEHDICMRCGDSWVCVLEGRMLPESMAFAWMTSIHALDRRGVTLIWRFQSIPDMHARRILDQSERAARDNIIAAASSRSASDVVAERGVSDMQRLRSDIINGRERLGQLHLLVIVSAETREAMQALVDEVRNSAAMSDLVLDPVPFEQVESFRFCLLSAPADASPPSLPIDTAARVCASMGPVTIAPPRQAAPGRVMWGVHARTGEPVLWDRRQAHNPHALVIASSGSGKTYAMRSMIAQEASLTDETILIIDPKLREYRELVRAFKGDYVTLSDDGQYAINPFDLPILPPDRLHAARKNNDRFLGQQATMIRSLIVQELAHYAITIGPRDYVRIEEAIVKAYTERGITDDPQSFVHASMPVFSDVQRLLADDLPVIAAAMDVFTCGTLGMLINRPSSVARARTGRLIGLDTSPLLAAEDPLLMRVIPSVLLAWTVNYALAAPHGAHIIADEAHVIIGNPTGMRVVERIFRVGRSLGLKATIITQSISDVHHDQARILSENSATKLLMGVSGDAASLIGRAFSLPQDAVDYLTQCRLVPGVGSYALLVAEMNHTPLLIPQWSEPLHHLACGRTLAPE